MSFGKLKRALKGLINRRDLTDELAGDFVNRAIDEIERVCRLGPMEKLLEASQWDGKRNAVTIPADFLEAVDLFTDEGTLRQVSKDQFFNHCDTGRPAVYIKSGRSFLVKPYPLPGSVLQLQYFGETPPLIADTDENVWTRSGFNAVLYAAAALAADYFQMEDVYVQRFQGKSDDLVAAMLAQDQAERWSGQLSIGRVQGDF